MPHASLSAVVLRNPDGTPMSKKQVILERRGAFKWLPILCSNDLVHGSWWFVWGSLLSMVIAIVPLADKQEQSDDQLPVIDRDVTWSLLSICGFFYTVGSYAFVRAFEEPPKLPLFHNIRHLQSDELLGAWLFLFGTIPAVPWSLVYFSLNPTALYMGLFLMSLVAVSGCVLFVLGCYPNEKKSENYLLPCCVHYCGSQIWMVKHFANDWLAGTWFFLWTSLVFLLGSFGYFCVAVANKASSQQIFIYTAGLFDAIFFAIGSLYFVAGSYPHASQFYYALDRAATPTKSTEKRQVKSFSRVKKSSSANMKSSDGDSHRLIGTKSQNMDLRLSSSVMNPIHDSAIASSAGHIKDKETSLAISELHDKLKITVDAIKSGQSVSNKSPSTSSTNIVGLLPVQLEASVVDVEVGSRKTALDILLLREQDDEDDEDNNDDDASHYEHVQSPLHIVANLKNDDSISRTRRNG